MKQFGWIAWVAIGLVLTLLAASSGSAPAVAQALSILALLSFVAAVVVGGRGIRRGRYDLRELERVHDRAELAEVEDHAPEFDSVLCLCGEVYDRRLPVCPVCGRSQGAP